jgi:iron complex transport system ATP-binding protein
VIELEDVGLSLGGVTVLDGVDLDVDRGEFVGLVGPNGAGKTSLLRTVNGVLAPDSGTVRLRGDPVATLGPRAVGRRVATVPQDTHLGFAFTAAQVVGMGRIPHRSRLDWSDGGAAVDAALDRAGVAALRDRPVDELSGGERKLVLLARALAQEAPALALDEPTASLDVAHQIRVLDVVSEYVSAGGAALAAIHDLDLAARYCDRLCLLSDGAVRAAGPPETVLDDSALGAAFDVRTAVAPDAVTGTPTVTAVGDPPSREGRVHLVGGGRETAVVLGALWRAGYTVTLGVVAEGDAAAAVADALDVTTVTAPPLSRPGERDRETARRLVERADAVVTVPGPEAGLLGDALEAHEPVVDASTRTAREVREAVAAVLDDRLQPEEAATAPRQPADPPAGKRDF